MFLLVGSFCFMNWQIGSQFSLSSLFYKYMCGCVLASIQQPPSLKQNLFLIRREGSLEQVKFVF